VPLDDAGDVVAPVDCATVEVPLDHDGPDGRQVPLAVYRLATADPDARLGHLVMNPGGPGGATKDFLVGISGALPVELTDRYDLVTFDPRGVGESDGLSCGTGVNLLAEMDDPFRGQQAHGEALAADCLAEDADLVPAMGTANVARDLELVRQALGDEDLTYLGYSYGTAIGAVYAELFPDRVGRFVLDGALDPNLGYLDTIIEQMIGFDQSLQLFAAACDREETCALQPYGALSVWRFLYWKAGVEGLATPDGRRVTAEQFLTASLGALYVGYWAYADLAQALLDAAWGDPTFFADAYESFVSDPSGPYFAVTCADETERYTVEEVQQASYRTLEAAPQFFWDVREVLGCSGFPPGDVLRPIVDVAEGEIPPVLVIGNTHDPATPYAWAVSLSGVLGGSRLLTFEGDGHTIFGYGIPCIDDAVVAYLVGGDLPAAGTRCQPPFEDGVPPAYWTP
jgi:pimeloyl-ACP methyl ester carboxylesterase